MCWDLFRISNIKGRNQDQSRFNRPFNAFNSIKNLQCTLIINFLGTFFTSFPARASREVYNIISLECVAKISYGCIL